MKKLMKYCTAVLIMTMLIQGAAFSKTNRFKKSPTLKSLRLALWHDGANAKPVVIKKKRKAYPEELSRVMGNRPKFAN